MTYLELVNGVLRRLRENQVETVQENDYAALIGDFVNDAKQLVEDSHSWSALRTAIDISTVSGTSVYALTGAGQDVEVREAMNTSTQVKSLIQGYLSLHPSRTVRVRIQDNQGMLTIKGKSNKTGTSRFEWEQFIPVDDAKQLLSLAEGSLIEKKRYLVPVNGFCFEVDVFEGDHTGLVIAEVELSSSEEHVDLPHWIGKEVTGDSRYYNSSLAQKLD